MAGNVGGTGILGALAAYYGGWIVGVIINTVILRIFGTIVRFTLT